MSETVELSIPAGAACFCNIYEPDFFLRSRYDTVRYSLSVPYDHPEILVEHLPFPPNIAASGYLCFRSKFPPEVDVRPANYKWLVRKVQEGKARNQRDSLLFERYPLVLTLKSYDWEFKERKGTSYQLTKVTILRGKQA